MGTLLDKFSELLLEDKSSQRNNIEILNDKQRIFEDKNIKKYDVKEKELIILLKQLNNQT